ncbi:MAG: YlmC/YmxH family sporulation protein [Clostridia bacterium]|nr:YlmC/YmxH family sporulation protein [Clostridia bacterium]
MHCCLTDMRYKEVINNSTGCRLGNVCDVEVDTCSGRVAAVIIYGRGKFLGLFGKTPDIIIPWDDICVIGEDTILVKYCPPDYKNPPPRKRGRFFEGIFR